MSNRIDLKREKKDARTLNGYVFAGITMVLILIIILSFGTVVRSASHVQDREMEQYYRVLEQEMHGKVWAFLSEQGYKNAGVMINHVTMDEQREYTITIHHNRLKRSSQSSLQALSEDICKLGFGGEECSFQVEYTF